MAGKTKSGGGRKIGRDAKKCQRYRMEGRQENNKAKRLAKEKKRQAGFKAKKEKRLEEYNARRREKTDNGGNTEQDQTGHVEIISSDTSM